MLISDLRRRRRNSRVLPRLRASLRAELALGLRALVDGDGVAAMEAFERVHEGARNAPLLHLGVHLGRLSVLLTRGQGGAALAELSPVMGAAPSSLLRRLRGIDPAAPAGPGLRGRLLRRKNAGAGAK